MRRRRVGGIVRKFNVGDEGELKGKLEREKGWERARCLEAISRSIRSRLGLCSCVRVRSYEI